MVRGRAFTAATAMPGREAMIINQRLADCISVVKIPRQAHPYDQRRQYPGAPKFDRPPCRRLADDSPARFSALADPVVYFPHARTC